MDTQSAFMSCFVSIVHHANLYFSYLRFTLIVHLIFSYALQNSLRFILCLTNWYLTSQYWAEHAVRKRSTSWGLVWPKQFKYMAHQSYPELAVDTSCGHLLWRNIFECNLHCGIFSIPAVSWFYQCLVDYADIWQCQCEALWWGCSSRVWCLREWQMM